MDFCLCVWRECSRGRNEDVGVDGRGVDVVVWADRGFLMRPLRPWEVEV